MKKTRVYFFSLLAVTLVCAFFLSGLLLCARGGTPVKKERVLIILTSHDKLGDTEKPTGYYLLTHPVEELITAGYDVEIASPKGGEAPMDPTSKDMEDPINKKFLEDSGLMSKVNHTVKIADIDAGKYVAVLYPGGHGPMWDLVDDQDSLKVARQIYEQGGIVAAVCHGPAAIAKLKLSNGKYLVEGKRVTGFTNAEEDAVGLTKTMPFLLETLLIQNGGKFEKADLWQAKIAVDGRVITGQNPASAKGVGEALVDSLAKVESK